MHTILVVEVLPVNITLPLISSLIVGLTLLALATMLLGAFHSSACSESLETFAPLGID